MAHVALRPEGKKQRMPHRTTAAELSRPFGPADVAEAGSLELAVRASHAAASAAAAAARL